MEGRGIRFISQGATILGIAILACAGFECGASSETGPVGTIGQPKSLPALTDSRITESSGVAPSQRDSRAFYTHNDSGDTARFFKFTLDGKVQREYRVSNAQAVDWEDMASATLEGNPYLFFGDIGDNAGRRDSLQIYRVPEPGRRRKVKADKIFDVRYPDGSHNAETLLVHPFTGDITIVTKAAAHPAAVYYLQRPKESGSYTLQKLSDIEIDSTIRAGKLITSGAWSPDGRSVVLRTYLGAFLYAADKEKPWYLQRPAQVRTNFDLQGEGITFTRDGHSLITTSEGHPCPLSQIDLTQ